MDRNKSLIPNGFDRKIRNYRKAAELPLINDGLRHTYATYWLKIHQNRNQLAELIGNSAEIIGRHYVKPVTKKDAEAFWKLLPRSDSISPEPCFEPHWGRPEVLSVSLNNYPQKRSSPPMRTVELRDDI